MSPFNDVTDAAEPAETAVPDELTRDRLFDLLTECGLSQRAIKKALTTAEAKGIIPPEEADNE